ncbi:radical SAM/SPASM domain-containing protein [Corynebacterium striatum]|uniref:radical SAM protein n=1 Tax=Corynebacterium striatum TaxID=43770 RepID=UPI003B5B3AAD
MSNQHFSAPVRASIDVTYACDLRCIHCRTNTGEIPLAIRRKMLSIEQLKTVIRDLDKMKTFEITLTGGEPTMRKGFWDLLKIVPDLSFSETTLITNAATHDMSLLDRIIDGGINSVRVSIDGTRSTFKDVRLVDKYDKVLENSIYLQKHVRSFKVLTTVMRTNLHNIFELVDDLRIAGIKRQDLILVRAHGRGARNNLLLTEAQTMKLHNKVQQFKAQVPKEVYDLNLNAPYLDPTVKPDVVQDVVLYPYLKQNTSIAISATGDVTMSRLYSSSPIGNVKDESIIDIWERGQKQLDEEIQSHTQDELRDVFWDFAAAEGKRSEPIPLTALLDRQIFEGVEVR